MTPGPPLLSAYWDDDLEPVERAELRSWLLEDPTHLHDFVVDGFVHTQLIELLGPEQVRANNLVAAAVWPEARRLSTVRLVAGRVVALAASLLFVVAIAYFTVFRAEVVATVTGTRDVQWVMGAERLSVGALLESGDELALDRGTLHIAFARGGQVALHGPARFRVESDVAGRIVRGGLSAFVPEHAVGFTVHSGLLTVVDLGTEFRVEVSTDQSCELQVFDGLVEVQLREPPRDVADGGKLHISQGRAFRFDAASGSVKPLDYDKSKRLPISVWSQ